MKLTLIKRPDQLFEVAPESEEEAAKIKIGETCEFAIKKVRDPIRHRAYFLMIKMAFDNQDFFTDIEEMRYYLQMKAGFYRKFKSPKGGVIYIPLSIKFAEMDELKFTKVRNAVRDVILKQFDFDPDNQEEIIRLGT
jgi:hypothetical protein